jgi:hypothetical protein
MLGVEKVFIREDQRKIMRYSMYYGGTELCQRCLAFGD